MFTVYSKSGCPYCEKVKALFDNLSVDYKSLELSVDYSRDDFYSLFGEGTTFPQVIYNETRIGGCTDTIKYLKEQNLI